MVNTFVSDSGIFVSMWSGERLLRLRQEQELSREALGHRTKLHPRTIENYERPSGDSKARVPDVDVVKRIADALGTNFAFLMNEIDDPSRDALQKLPSNEVKNFQLSIDDAELADPERMKLLQRELEIITQLRLGREKQIRSNTRSDKDSSAGN